MRADPVPLAQREQYFRSAEGRAVADRMKGLLIICIVLAHNMMITRPLKIFDDLLYQFHVFGFFFVAITARGFLGPRTDLRRLLIRYLVPFAWFVALGSLLFAASHRFAEPTPATIAFALAIGSAATVKAATGASLWWFLPALFGFTALHYLVASARTWSRTGLVILSVTWLAAVITILPTLEVAALQMLPFGIAIAVVIYPLAILFFLVVSENTPHSHDRARPSWLVLTLATIAVAVCETLLLGTRTIVNLSELSLGQQQLSTLIAGLTMPVLANLALYSLSASMQAKWLQYTGRLSLQIYLLHFFVQVPLVRVAGLLVGDKWTGLFVGLAISVLTLVCCLLIGRLLLRVDPIANVLFPRDLNDLLHPRRPR